jgi:hypothetical protein
MRPHLRSLRALTLRLSALGLLAALIPVAASAVPPIGFRQDFPGTSLQDWGGGSLYDNPGTGGVDGAGDGYLKMWTPTPYSLGTVNMAAPFPGDWVAAGITKIKVSFNDVGTPESLVMHCIIANQFTIWQYNPGFIPPHNQWQEFTVDLTAAGDWKRLTGSASFLETLASVDRLHFRHDLTPYIHTPDPIQADVGMDRLIITNDVTPVQATTWGRIKRLYH